MCELILQRIVRNCCYFGRGEEQDDLIANPEILVGLVVQLVTHQLHSLTGFAQQAFRISFGTFA